jgi:DNA polymerase III subunit epsilon
LDRDDVLILDTETTGMRGAEVIEVALIDTRGEVLLETLVKPKRACMNPYAERVHGISLAMLEHAPSWQDVFPALCELADRRTLLAWNAPFDAGMLEQTSAAWGLEHPRWLFVCAMRLYAKSRGLRARGLHKAVADEALSHLLARYPSHRALGDVRFVLEVLRAAQGRAA